jgi:predicted metalloprotease with PDZ domain
VDGTHASLIGTATFLAVRGFEAAQQHLEIDAPAGQRVTAALSRAEGHAQALVAPSYDALVDAPIEIGHHHETTFEAAGKRHVLAVWPVGSVSAHT